MKQTAVEWFLTEFQKQVWFEPNSELDIWVKDLIPKAKEMEKEQIIKAYETAMETDIYNEPLKIGKDYYEQTFKSE
jgi:hypothetical protein